jgi:RND superfamily putative drug exporter
MLGTLGSFVVRHARAVLVASVIVLVGVGVLGAGAFGKLQTGGFEDPDAESSAASALVEERFGGDADILFLVTADAGTVDDPAPAAAGAELTAAMVGDPALSQVVSYWNSGAPTLRSDDGTQALIVANLEDGTPRRSPSDTAEPADRWRSRPAAGPSRARM